MGNPGESSAAGEGVLESFRFNISHQEMDKIVTELDTVYNSQPTEWLPTEGIGRMICNELGYEDMDEFEDAVKGNFEEFLSSLPNVEVKEDEVDTDGAKVKKFFFKILPPPPPEQRRPMKMTLKILSRKDLWTVCLKSPYAKIEIPELEFEIGADHKRNIDSLYNHMCMAITNLGNYVRANSQAIPEDQQNKILDTIYVLNVMLDVEKPFTIILHDPSGLSEMKPMDDVTVEYLEGSVVA